MRIITLNELFKSGGIFTDGDWIESKDQDQNGDVRLVQLADIGVNKFLNKSNRFLTTTRSKELKCTYLQKNDILICRMPDPLGKACIFPGDIKLCATVVDVSILRPNQSIINPLFLAYQINSQLVRNQIEQYVTGTTRKRISRKNLGKIKISLPPLEIQHRIVKILDQANALRQKRKEAIRLLDEYVKSVFLEMFGDPVSNPKGWSKIPLGTMIEFLTSGSRGWAKYYSNSGSAFIRIQNVGKNELFLDDICYVSPPDSAESKRTKVKEGDILLSITADLGRTAVIPKDLSTAHISQHLALIRLKRGFISGYVSEFLASEGGKYQMERLNKGGTKAGLNFNDIRSISVPSPPLSIQQEYLLRKQDALSIKQKMLQQSQEFDTQFQALMQKAFRGEL